MCLWYMYKMYRLLKVPCEATGEGLGRYLGI